LKGDAGVAAWEAGDPPALHCSLCGREAQADRFVRFRGVALCPVCEHLTVVLRPGHPLYAFWASLFRGCLTFGGDEA
jgi:hypothetical protein